MFPPINELPISIRYEVSNLDFLPRMGICYKLLETLLLRFMSRILRLRSILK
jgi:hypothetical protein